VFSVARRYVTVDPVECVTPIANSVAFPLVVTFVGVEAPPDAATAVNVMVFATFTDSPLLHVTLPGVAVSNVAL
jgi:hypothetical protein